MSSTKLLHSFFESCSSSDSMSSRIALRSKNSTLSYQELDLRANQLANYLLAQGVQPGDLVGIYFNPCFEQIISLLAILKVGAAYLPLDTHLPVDRLEYILTDSTPSLLLTNSQTKVTFNDVTKTVFFDQLDEVLLNYDGQVPSITIPEDSLAYVIYTSGTSGRPKGVMISHQSVRNTVNQMNDIFRLGTEDSILLNTSLGFDPSVWMLFWPLSIGASVILAEFEKDPDYLLDMITLHKIKVFHAGPTLFRILFAQPKISQCSSLELIIGGGEAWKRFDLTTLKRYLPDCELCNVYGPTEASIHASFWRSDSLFDMTDDEIPIGKPIKNMEVLILDEEGHQCIAGQVGELYLTGIGLGDGYLNNPKLTQEKFLSITRDNVERRYYRTGDLVKRLADGNLVFMGRVDSQIKLRGFRIEPGEIEKQILRLNLFSDAVVIGYCERNVITKLLAFLIPQDLNNFVEPQTISAHLKQVLPYYMIPSQYIFLKQFPKTLNEKIDKEQLVLMFQKMSSIEVYQPPSTVDADPLGMLSTIWMRILKLKDIDVNQHFFDLGGDSLIALDLIAELNKCLDLNLNVTILFEYPTLNELSKFLNSMEKKGGVKPNDSSEPPLLGRRKCSLSDNQLWLNRMAKGSLSINNIVMPFQVDGSLHVEILKQAIQELILYFPLLSISIIKTSEVYEMRLLKRNLNDIFSSYDIKNFSEQDKTVFLQEQYDYLNEQTICLETDPLFKVILIQGCSGGDYLYVYTHHLISDPATGQMIIQQLLSDYQNLLENKPLNTHEEVGSFFDYVAHEQKNKEQIAYQENLKRNSEILSSSNWFVEFGRISDSDLSGAYCEFILPEMIAQKIKQALSLYKVTPFNYFLSLLKWTLFLLYKQEKFGIGINISQRSNHLWSKMVGPLSEQAISTVDFSTIQNFSELLQLTNQNINSIYKSSVSIESLLQEIQKTKPELTDLFNVLFDYEKGSKELKIGSLAVKNFSPKSLLQVRRHLTVRVREEGEQFLLQFRFRKNLLKEQDIIAIKNCFIDLIKSNLSATIALEYE